MNQNRDTRDPSGAGETGRAVRTGRPFTLRLPLYLALVAAFVACGYLFWTGIQRGIREGSGTGVGSKTSPSPDEQLSHFFRAARNVTGADDDTMLEDLECLIVASADGAPAEERRAILALPAGRVPRDKLLSFPDVVRLLTVFEKTGQIDPLHFLHEDQKQRLRALFPAEDLTAEKCVQIRQELTHARTAFHILRTGSRQLQAVAVSAPPPLAAWVEEACLDRYEMPLLPPRAALPLLGGDEVRIVERLEAFLNSAAAKKALPRETYTKLYPRGLDRVPPFPAALKVYSPSLRDRLAQEADTLGKGRPAEDQEKIRKALLALGNFCDKIGEGSFAR